jgi:hypothetical protein
LAPLRAGVIYGLIAALVTALISFRFLYLNPSETTDWVLAVAETFSPQLAAASQLFLALLAAISAKPVRLDEDVPYRSLLLRDCTLAATVVAVIVGVALLAITALQATLFAEPIRSYAQDAAPPIVSYVNESRAELSEPPPAATVEQVMSSLMPPSLGDMGRSIFNLVLRALVLGFTGALVGLLRGSFGSTEQQSGEQKTGPG